MTNGSQTSLLPPGSWRIATSRSRLEILVAREGALSTLGHDLFVDARRFEGRVFGGGERVEVEVTIDAASVVPRCARRDEQELPGGLSASDLRDVERNLQKDTLRSARYPRIVFRAKDVAAGTNPRAILIPGRLDLAGREARALVEAEQPEAGTPRFLVRCRLRQSDHGITPYRAFLGALRIRDEVIVRGTIVLERVPD